MSTRPADQPDQPDEPDPPVPLAGPGRQPSRLRSTGIATAGIVLGSVPGMLLPFAITGWFGAQSRTDAYFLTLSAAMFAATVLSIVMERAVVPFAATALDSGSRALSALLRRLLPQVAAGALAAYAVAAAVVVVVVVPTTTLGVQESDLVKDLVLLLAPFPVLAAMSSVVAASLFAAQRFGLATWSLALRALGALAAGLLLQDEIGLEAVAAGLSLGEAARLLVLSLALGRVGRALPEGPGSESSAGFWRVAAPHVLSMSVVSVTGLVDRSVAAGLEPGSATVFELCDKLYYAPAVLIGSGIATVSGAAWAGMMATERRAELRRDFARSQAFAGAAATAVALAAAVVVWLAASRVQEEFGIPSELPFALTFAILMIGLPFGLSADLTVRLLIAFRRTWVFTVSAVVILTLTVVGDVVGAALFGLPGIAGASALTRAANALLLGVAALRLLSAPVEVSSPSLTASRP